VLIAIGPLLLGALIAGFAVWEDNTFWIHSSSAEVSGSMIEVTSPGAGEVADLPYDVGDYVQAGETIATINMTYTPPLGQAATVATVLVPVKSPVTGTIIKRYVHQGEQATSGGQLFTLVDLTKLYVIADVDESSVPYLHIGEPATIYLNSYDQNLNGIVGGLTPATSNLVTSSSAAAQAASTSSTPQVPVIVYFNTPTINQNYNLFPGMSANVSIQIH
jgi:multidrug resistance efflux pump